MLYLKEFKIYMVVTLYLIILLCVYLKSVGDIAWITRVLQNMEDSIFVPKPTRHFNLDNHDFDVTDNNGNIP